MAGKKKVVKPAPEPEAVPEPILIIDSTPAPAPEPPETFKVEEGPKVQHRCNKCGKMVDVYETVCSQTIKGYCSTNCYIAR